MIRKTLLATVATVIALSAAPAMADGYLGTYGRQDNNADIARVEAPSGNFASAFADGVREFGAPRATIVRVDGQRENVAPEQANDGEYLGTSRRYQDNADTNMR